MPKEYTLDEIITKAIPQETCPIKNMGAMNRRELLKKRLNDYIGKQLSNQFNAKVYDQPVSSNGVG